MESSYLKFVGVNVVHPSLLLRRLRMNTSQQGIEKHLLRSGPHIDDDFRSSNLNRLVRSYIQGHKVLDVGCGTGTLAMELVRRGHDVICQDSSQELTDLCRLMFAKWSIRHDGRRRPSSTAFSCFMTLTPARPPPDARRSQAG